MLVSFIVPLYNQLACTQAMLESLRNTLPAGLSYEIIFVDDGSSDGTRAWLAQLRDEHIRVLLNERNLGYAGANNAGARLATGDFLALLNNDLVLEAGWLQPLLKLAQARFGRIGMVGNVQLRASDRVPDHAGIEATLEGKLSHLRQHPPGKTRQTFAVTAACCLLRRELFLAVGGFDERYRNGAEDVDLAMKLRRRGLKAVVALDSVVLHRVSASRGPSSLRDEQNSWQLYQLWHDEIVAEVARRHCAALVAGEADANGPVSRRDRLAARLHLTGLAAAPLRARLMALKAVWREETRWRELFKATLPPPASGWSLQGFRHDHRYPWAWIDDRAVLTLPPAEPADNLFLSGKILGCDERTPTDQGSLGLRVTINQIRTETVPVLEEGHFNLGIKDPPSSPDRPTVVEIELLGVSRGNRLGKLARLTRFLPIPPALWLKISVYRERLLNRRLRLIHIVGDDRRLVDFETPDKFGKHLLLRGRPAGLNVVGWLRAELGIGESARCMARACNAAKLPVALVDMKLPCLNRMGDTSFAARLQEDNPQAVNVFHIDPPVARDIDHHHGEDFRRARLNIAYWAWELPEFPDDWVPQAAYFDEIWCPSDFVRQAIAAKVSIPVRVMPHAIEVPAHLGPDRARFGLPSERFLFLFLYDLNSYQERKNPQAVIEAYRRAFPGESGVALVIKTQNPERNPEAYAKLQASLTGLSQVTLIAATLPREDILRLEASCDAFVSLHRSEGFGLSVAECMALGKPVISTDWSATAEFLDASCGCPVKARLLKLDRDHGPYKAGSTWADPDVDQAADEMRRLASDPALCARLGDAARARVQERLAPTVVGALYRKRLQELGLA